MSSSLPLFTNAAVMEDPSGTTLPDSRDPLRHATQGDFRKVHLRRRRKIEIVCENVQCDMSNDLGDCTFAEAGLPHRFEIGIRDLTFPDKHLLREGERRC